MDWSMLLGQLFGILLSALIIAVGILAVKLRQVNDEARMARNVAKCLDENITNQRVTMEELEADTERLAEALAAEQQACRAAREQAAELDRGQANLMRERDLLRKERDEARAVLAAAHEQRRKQAARFLRVGNILESIEAELAAAKRVADEGEAEEQPQPVGKDGSTEIPF